MKKTWNSLRLKYSDPVEILRTLDVEDGIRILVIGNGSMGAYEWVIEKGLHVDQHSDVGYGCADIALRDGLIAYYGPPRSSESETSTREDPGTIKLLTNLVDRMYKMHLMAIPSLRVTEQDPNSNDPIVAWMSDVRSVLYQNKPVPDPVRDLLGSAK